MTNELKWRWKNNAKNKKAQMIKQYNSLQWNWKLNA